MQLLSSSRSLDCLTSSSSELKLVSPSLLAPTHSCYQQLLIRVTKIQEVPWGSPAWKRKVHLYCHTLHYVWTLKKGTVNELMGGLHSRCSKPNFRKCVWNFQWDVNASVFKSFAKYLVMSYIWSMLNMNLHHKCVQYSGQIRESFSSDLAVIWLSHRFHAFWTHRLVCCINRMLINCHSLHM